MSLKVAFLLFGQPRNIDNGQVFQSHKKWIIDRYETDVFCHAWWTPDMTEYRISEWTEDPINPIKINPKTNEIIINNYKPVAYQFDPSETFSLSDSATELVKNNFSKNRFDNRNNILSQLASIERVGQLFIEKSTKQYDFVVLGRYDRMIDEISDFNHLSKNKFHVWNNHPHSDYYNIFAPRFINFTKIFSNVENILIKNKQYFNTNMFWDFTPECLKCNHFLSLFDPRDIAPFSMSEHRI